VEDVFYMNTNDEKNTTEPTLSACIIVKNEEKILEQCLDSIKDVVNEIIIVDTGSTDNTVEIAKRYTNRVYFHEWQNDFSEARNYSLQYATGDWILIIDADEKLEKDDIPILRHTLKRNEYNSIYFSVLSDIPSGISKNYSQRVFRRGKGYYDGIIHNQLVCEGDTVVTDIRMYHYGYNLNPEQMQKKFKRTESLLKKQLADNPNFGFAWMNLVRIYKCQKLWDDVIKTAEEALNTKREFLDGVAYQMITYDMAYALFTNEEYDKSEKICMDLLRQYPDNLDANFLIGSISIRKKNYKKAIRNYMKYIQLSKENPDDLDNTNLIVDTYASQWQAWNNIGSAYAELDQPDKAIDAYSRALLYKKASVYNVLHNLAMLYLRLQEREKSQEYLDIIRELDGIGSDQYMAMSDDLVNMREYSLAITFYEKCLQADPKNTSALINLATCYAELGMYESAIIGYRSALEISPEDPIIIQNLLIMKEIIENNVRDS
jgi:glycosyltransferase involved in cell wall biosynthesis